MLQVYKYIDDLPVWNFLKVLKTDDKRYLLHLPNYFELPECDLITLNETWDDIQAQIIDLNGVSEDYQELLQNQKDIMIMKVDILASQDDSTIPIMRKKERALIEKMQSKKDSVDWDDLIAQMEIKFKFQFDLNKMSVARLFKYLKHFSDGRKSD